jgi:alpha-beta hydrolase superfamily lysophospholipase
MTTKGVHPNGIDTIVLIHGLWVTTFSWEHWISRYQARGYRVLAPNWPGMDAGIEDLRRNPSGIARLGVTEIADHYDHLVRALDPPPAIIGHCLGGLVVQILLNRGLGAVGVAIDPAPAEGVRKSSFAKRVLGRPAPTHVDFGTAQRAPLLLIASGKNRIFPAAVTRSSFLRYRASAAITAYQEYPARSHYTLGEPGWEQVADYALRWAMENALNGT